MGLAEHLVDESHDALIGVSPGGHVRFWNAGAERIFGYPAAEAVGAALDALIVPADRREESRRHLVTVAQDGAIELETVRRRRNGASLYVESRMRLLQPPGEEPVIACCERDVSHLHRLRQQQASDARFRGLLEAAPDAMIIVNQLGVMELVNAQAESLFGYRREEMVGQPIELLIPESVRAHHPRHREGYHAAPNVRPMGAGLDLFGRRKNGTEFACDISLSPIETPDGMLVTAAVRDVTQRKQDMEEQSRRSAESSRLKSEFLANMSHELRTPLNAIIGFSSLLHSGKAGPLLDVQQEYLGDVLTSARHLLQLINDVLDLAKVESGKTELLLDVVELPQVAGEVRDILRGLAAERRVKLKVEVDPTLPKVVVDARMLKQILYNYLSNAIKFTPEGGSVIARLVPDSGERFRIDVEDTGIGIKAEDLEKLFVEFQQLDASATKRYAGTGLGLALTKRIVEAQGGTVAVRSQPGVGSTFSAVLPFEVKHGG